MNFNRHINCLKKTKIFHIVFHIFEVGHQMSFYNHFKEISVHAHAALYFSAATLRKKSSYLSRLKYIEHTALEILQRILHSAYNCILKSFEDVHHTF